MSDFVFLKIVFIIIIIHEICSGDTEVLLQIKNTDDIEKYINVFKN